MGMRMPWCVRRRCNSKPSSSGIATSSTRQAWSSGRKASRNRLDRGETAHLEPLGAQQTGERFDHLRLIVEEIHDAVRIAHGLLEVPGNGQFEVENGAALGMRLCPKPAVVRGHNGPADGQAQAQALGLGGVERLEEALRRRPANRCPRPARRHAPGPRGASSGDEAGARRAHWRPWRQPR